MWNNLKILNLELIKLAIANDISIKSSILITFFMLFKELNTFFVKVKQRIFN